MKKMFLGLAFITLCANAVSLTAMESNTGNDSGNSGNSNGGYEGSGMDHTETSGGWGSGVGNDGGNYGGWDSGMDNTTTSANDK